ncbi:hypothetical protein CDD83_6168 [Cordyceps sp. RAO-2017]|nr:hypothetical protein CDD83_6168 [Cordyceps sp. RAO-2017]
MKFGLAVFAFGLIGTVAADEFWSGTCNRASQNCNYRERIKAWKDKQGKQHYRWMDRSGRCRRPACTRDGRACSKSAQTGHIACS